MVSKMLFLITLQNTHVWLQNLPDINRNVLMFKLKFNMLERCNLGVIVCDDLKIAEDMLRA